MEEITNKRNAKFVFNNLEYLELDNIVGITMWLDRVEILSLKGEKYMDTYLNKNDILYYSLW